MPGPFDPASYGLPPSSGDPFGDPQPTEQADPFAAAAPPEPEEPDQPWSWIPDSWRAIAEQASAGGEQGGPAPAPPIDPLGLPASTLAGVDAALAAPPAAPPADAAGAHLPNRLGLPASTQTAVDQALESPPSPSSGPTWLQGMAGTLGGATPAPEAGAPAPASGWPSWLGGAVPAAAAAATLPIVGPAIAPIAGLAGAAAGALPLPPQPPRALNSVFDVLAIEDPQEREKALRELPDEKFAQFQLEHEQARKDLVEAERISESTKAKRAAEADAQSYETGLRAKQREADRLAGESLRLAQLRVDDNHWFSDGGVGRTLASFVVGIVGGFLQAKTGGRNLGLEWIDHQIDRDLEVQKANILNARTGLENQRGILADQLRQGRDIHEAMRVAKIASYDRVIAELDQRAAMFDPKGTQALRAEGARRQFLAERNALALKHLSETQKAAEAADRTRLAREKFEEEKRLNAQRAREKKIDQSIDWSRLSDARTKEAEDRKLKREEIEAQKEAKTQDRADKQADKDLEQTIGGEVRPKVVTTVDPVTGAKTQSTAYEQDKLRNADGKEFRTNKETQQKLLAQRAGTQDLVDALDGLKQLHANAGGANALTSPSDQAEYKRLTDKAIIAYAASKGISLADEQSQNFARDAILGKDPGGYHIGDVTSRIERSIADGTRSYNTALRGAGYSGQAVAFNRVADLPKTELTSEEESRGRLRAKPSIAIDEAERQELRQLQDATPKDSPDGQGWKSSTASQMLAEARRRASEYKDIAPDQRRTLEDLARRAHGTTPQAEQARAELAALAGGEGGTEPIRAAAKAALESAQLGAVGSPEPLPGVE